MNRHLLGATTLLAIGLPAFTQPTEAWLAVGPVNGDPEVLLFDVGPPLAINPYGTVTTIEIAAGNIDGGPVGELLTGPGGGHLGPHVRAFRQDGSPLNRVSFYAYGTLRAGSLVASGSVDADPFDEIVTGAGPSAVFGPHVRGFDFDGASLRAMPGVNAFAYQTLRWGVHPWRGDVDGDGFSEILTAPGPGVVFSSHVRGFDLDGGPLQSLARINFQAFSTGRHGGWLASDDADGDGFAEIVAAAGPDPGMGADVAGFDFDDASITPLPNYRLLGVYPGLYGARLGMGDVDATRTWDAMVSPGPDPTAAPDVSIFSYDTGTPLTLFSVSLTTPGTGCSPTSGASADRIACNGGAGNCDRAYDDVSVICTHNAYSNEEDGFWLPTPNQKYSFERQLDDGVRCMMLDTYMEQGEPSLCHAHCGLGATPWIPMLQSVDEWLEENPGSVLSFILEPYITETETEQALRDAGIFDRVYHHTGPPGTPWPTLRQLLETDQRLVVFTADAAANDTWHLNWTRFGWETPFDDPTFTCADGRGDPTVTEHQVFILNHYVLCSTGGCESNGS